MTSSESDKEEPVDFHRGFAWRYYVMRTQADANKFHQCVSLVHKDRVLVQAIQTVTGFPVRVFGDEKTTERDRSLSHWACQPTIHRERVGQRQRGQGVQPACRIFHHSGGGGGGGVPCEKQQFHQPGRTVVFAFRLDFLQCCS